MLRRPTRKYGTWFLIPGAAVMLGTVWQYRLRLEHEEDKYSYCKSYYDNWSCLAAGKELPRYLTAEVSKAAKKKLKPVVYIGASWCPPCQALKKFYQDPLMISAFSGVYVIELSIEDWRSEDLQAYGLKSDSLPVFYFVDDSGHAQGPRLTGDAWKEITPNDMAAALKHFFSGSAAQPR